MRFGELFAGAGGLSLGLERAGWECAFHVEIAPHPRAILHYRWPNVPLHSDVVALSGGRKMKRWLQEKYAGKIDLISGGSPCQDLSVAGKRAGLKGDRSSLFYRQMRLWKILGADLCLWENVDGARSSNDGQDFGEVLRAFVGAAVPVPSDGWRSAGVAAGPAGVAAWRVLDAQFFGVPQRRRRVFVLGTRTGRVDPAEVLSLAESVRGDTPESGEAREGAAGRADEGAGESRGVIAFDWQAGGSGDESFRGKSRAYVVRAGDYTGSLQSVKRDAVLSFTQDSTPQVGEEISSSLKIGTGLDIGQPPCVLAFDAKQDGDKGRGSISPTLTVGADGGPKWIGILGEVSHALTHEGADAPEDGTGRGTPIVADTITANYGKQIDSRDSAKGPPNLIHTGVPRRLTPRECERLQGWPDDHTLVPYNGKPLSDSARYKACGNGVASVHSHWIGWRLRLALEAGVRVTEPGEKPE